MELTTFAALTTVMTLRVMTFTEFLPKIQGILSIICAECLIIDWIIFSMYAEFPVFTVLMCSFCTSSLMYLEIWWRTFHSMKDAPTQEERLAFLHCNTWITRSYFEYCCLGIVLYIGCAIRQI